MDCQVHYQHQVRRVLKGVFFCHVILLLMHQSLLSQSYLPEEITLANQSQNEIKAIPDYEEHDLYGVGRVKSVMQFSYTVIDTLPEIVKGEIGYDRFRDNCYLKFNRQGKITKSIYYNNYGIMSFQFNYYYNKNGLLKTTFLRSNRGKTRDDYKYDKNGLLVSEIDYDWNEEVEEKTFYEYDNVNILIVKFGMNPDGDITYKYSYNYDSVGSLTEVFYWDPSEDAEFLIKTFEYDQYRKLAGYSWFQSDGSLWTKHSYIYDTEGRIVEHLKCHPNGNPCRKQSYEFDDKGNILQYSDYYWEGKIETRRYEYRFDDKVNWNRRIGYIDSIPKYIIEREIKYYK